MREELKLDIVKNEKQQRNVNSRELMDNKSRTCSKNRNKR